MENCDRATAGNWTEVVEDLMRTGEVDRALSFMESTVSILENRCEKTDFHGKEGGELWSAVANELIFALKELSKLYSTKGLLTRADETVSRALQIECRKGELPTKEFSTLDESSQAGVSQTGATANEITEHGAYDEKSLSARDDGFAQEIGVEDDDWEANADRAPEEFLSSLCTPGVSKPILTDKESKSYRRRGRGPFVYSTQDMYRDNKSEKLIDDSEDSSEKLLDDSEDSSEKLLDDSEDSSESLAEEFGKGTSIYGTSHVLVLADLPLSTRTSDLEKLLKNFKDRFVIRWVNETTSLAVFRTPSDASEATNTIRFPFLVRLLTEDDELLSSIPPKDLVPPRPRPQTSVRTAQRMIAHGMGIRLPSTLASNEFRAQEAARRDRIVSRKNLRDDAWGD